MARETFTFQTEVGRLLEIVAHSLYSHKEIFLRELISNASDACDRLRYAALTEPALSDGDSDFKIRLDIDKAARTLSVSDNGIGMNREELVETLGTIARSGTQSFVAQLTGDAKKDVALIGQFGVGFYSAFMVAERVDVITRRAGEDSAWSWSSDGKGAFTIDNAQREQRGTTVILHLNPDEDEFLEPARIRRIVKTYSDHIGFPIVLMEPASSESEKDAAGEGPAEGDDGAGGEQTLNTASSLWTRPKKDITEDQYKEFYHHVSHAFDDPWLVIHNTVEGVVSYTSLLFVPSSAPFDLFDAERKSKVKLFVKRVYITDDCTGLLPSYLRFLRGIVDSEDLPLNISRETFQHDPRLAKMKSGIVKRVLDELARKAQDAEGYETFWGEFGAVLKEGIYEDFENRERILELARFHSTAGDGLTSLAAYVERMKPGQDAIYTISGAETEALRRSPQLEGFRAKGVEVLLLTDPIDEFWLPVMRAYKDKPFRSAAAAGTDLSAITTPDEADTAAADKGEAEPQESLDRLIAALKAALGDAVKDVRRSHRLTESAVCLVAGEGDINMNIERLLRQHRQLDETVQRILEINPAHPLIHRLAARTGAGDAATSELADAAFLLLDQARILEGEPVVDPGAFARRMTAMMERGIADPGHGDGAPEAVDAGKADATAD
ncbi:MAG: molecular chaperone HtpG [Rhodospirillales bacterium]|nr:molecular chaperone HtpG [Rhodospirillales bacterium]